MCSVLKIYTDYGIIEVFSVQVFSADRGDLPDTIRGLHAIVVCYIYPWGAG